MIQVKSEVLELRGIKNQESKNGKVYYIVNCESADGTPMAFYCPDASAFAEGLKKGSMVTITFDVSRYQGNDRLIVKAVENFEG